MFSKIMVPVDLANLERLDRALDVAVKLSKDWDTPIVYVGVTTNVPSEAGHTPEEFADRMATFAHKQTHEHQLHGAEGVSYVSLDPSIELEQTLLRAASETGADLIVVGSHKPGLKEHVFASHGGYLASHAPVSVFVVR